jgi:heterotetrameric sarcosine oxidase gamma subunit
VPEALVLGEQAPGTVWMVQGPGASAESILGFALPAAHRWVRQQGWTIYWVGPTAWQLVHADAVTEYERKRDALIAAGGALFDVSDARAAISVKGARAGELLASGCGIDFDAGAFPAGECRSSLLARVAVLITKRDETPSFRLFVPRSYAASLRSWLELGARQYGWVKSDAA